MMECRGVRLIPSGPQFRCCNWFPVILTTLTKALMLTLCILASNNFYLRLTGEKYVNLRSSDQPWPPVTDIDSAECEELTLVEDKFTYQTVTYFDSCSADSELDDKSVNWSVGELGVSPDPGTKISFRKWCKDGPQYLLDYTIVYAEKREVNGEVKTYFKMAANVGKVRPINQAIFSSSNSVQVYCGHISFTYGPFIPVLYWLLVFILIPVLMTLLHNCLNFHVFSSNCDFITLGVFSYYHVGPSTYNGGTAR